MTPTELYILYAFLGFITVLLVTIVGFLVRIAWSVGQMQGQYNNVSEQLREMNAALTARIERLEREMTNFREQLGELRGLMRALHDRMDLLIRHHHDDDGRVVIVPEEAAAAD